MLQVSSISQSLAATSFATPKVKAARHLALSRKTPVLMALAMLLLALFSSPFAVSQSNCFSVNFGVTGVPFDSGVAAAAGGVAPYQYSLTGTLPAGLTLNPSTGQVTGTPNARGQFSVLAKDAYGVAELSCPITIGALSYPSAVLGVANAYNIVALKGSINSTADITGRIAALGSIGTATTVGTALRTSDPYLSAASANGGPFAIVAAGGITTGDSFNVNAGGNVYSSTPSTAGFNFANEEYFGSPYTGSRLITGGSSPVDFNGLQSSITNLSTQLAGLNAYGAVCSVDNGGALIARGSCPASPVFFNSNSQHYNPSWTVLYGTSTSLNVFQVTAQQLQDPTRNLDIEVPAGSTVIINVSGASVTLQNGIYFQGNTVTDANAGTIVLNLPAATSVSVNGQFDGLLLAPNAALTGTSQMGGVFLAASIGSTGEVHYAPFTGALPWSSSAPALSVTCAAVSSGTVGVAFDSGAVSVSGGTGPYTFSVLGMLPAGLTLTSSSGQISGNPTAAGSFEVAVTDVNGVSGAACPITINSPLSLRRPSVNAGVAGVPFDGGPMSATGGTAPYTYSIVGTLPAGLSLNGSNGRINGTATATGSFAVKVMDAAGNSAISDTITIYGALSISCAAVKTGAVGVPFNSGDMTASGGSAPYRYAVVGTLPPGLILNSSTGAVTGTPSAAGTFAVKVTDSLGNSSVSCNITIVGSVSISCPVLHTGTVGLQFNSGAATVSGGSAPYSYAVVGTLPAGLTLDSSTGAVSGRPSAAGTFSLKVTDSLGNSSISCNITIYGALSISGPATNTGTVGVPFNSGAITVSGGSAPYNYAVVGTLPAGLTLNSSTGAVTGTPTAAGTFAIKVTDAIVNSATSTSITIYGALSITCAAVNTGTVGVPFNSGAMTVSGGSAPYSYAVVGTLPAGLTLNSATGAVTGTPTAAGTFAVKVTDSLGNSSTSCTISIYGSLSITCAAVNTGTVGVPFNSGAMTVSGGSAPYSYAIVGTLPAGLALNASNGAVTGTPTTAGTFAVKVTDSLGNSRTSCNVIISAALATTCAPVNRGQAGVAFNSGVVTTTGGTAPYTYSISGTLPSGLSLDSTTGAVSGTPRASGTFSVQVTDAKGATASACPITINAGLSVACAGVNTGMVGVAFNSGSPTVSGGTAPYAYSIVGTLPSGLSLNSSNGSVNGTPTTSGTFRVQVSDAAGASDTSCAVIINALAPLVVACPATTSGNVGVSFNSGSMSVSGGRSPYSYSIAGVLPVGLTLNASTGAVTGTPTAPGTFQIKVTDATSATNSTCSITINPAALPLGPNDTATIGYWNNKNGQALINALNGGSTATNLGNWLATNFPYLYGANSSNNLAGKTNADVAALDAKFFDQTGQPTSAQILGGALAAYVTNATLAGTPAAIGYGFNFSSTGTGAKTINVGSDGGGAGLTNNTSYSVFNLLQQANKQTQLGVFDGTTFNSIFTKINQTGDLNGSANTVSPSYTLTVSPQNVSVVAGKSASATFTFSPVGGYTGTVNFTCSGLPAGATCTFTPATVTANGLNAVQTATLTITTDATGNATIAEGQSPRGPLLAGILLVPGLLFAGSFGLRQRRVAARARGLWLMVLLGLAMTGGLVGCGSVVAYIPGYVGPHTVSVVTKAKVATPGGATTTTQSADFTLTIVQ